MSRLEAAPPRSRASGGRAGRLLTALLAAIAFFTQGCQRPPEDPLEQHAREFVELATAVGTFRPDEVDAYFGPAEFDERVTKEPAKPADLLARTQTLLAAISADPQVLSAARGERLKSRVESLVSMLELSSMARPPLFADEARRLYGIELPPADSEAMQRLLRELGDLLPGTGTLAFKLASFQNRLVVPAGKREAVFHRALEECKRRTQAHWTLPQNEQLTVEFTRAVDSAWHRYEGGGRSRLQINPLAVAFVGASLDVACHEGYPGHHAQFLLFDSNVPQGLPLEERVVLLRSPDSVLREGAANYGIDLVWSPEERLAFERDVLFPLAGLPSGQAATAAKVQRLLTGLGVAVIPLLQEYRDGLISFNTATFRLEREALVPSPAALLEFVDQHGAYVAGYTVARQRVQEVVTRETRSTGESEWAVLQRILVGPDVDVLKISPLPSGREAAPASMPAS